VDPEHQNVRRISIPMLSRQCIALADLTNRRGWSLIALQRAPGPYAGAHYSEEKPWRDR
jgi:hypothetical protein